MPGFPEVSETVRSMTGSVFSALAHKLANYEGEVYPLHVGDTWMEPGVCMEELTVAEHPGMHKYCQPQGLPVLLDQLVERLRSRDMPTERGSILVSAGATGGLGAVVGAIVQPGEEVLILAPFWPLIAGIVRSGHGVPVPVPVFGAVDSPEGMVAALEAARTERTAAVYLNSPNNPTGTVLSDVWLSAIAEWARAHDLWILSDEVYEETNFAGPHRYMRSIAPERTFGVHSFSKAFGMAGNRCGYVVGPADVMGHVRKISVHSFYSTPTASQLAAAKLLAGPGADWAANARREYEALANYAADTLGMPRPAGSTFLFIDVAHKIDDRGLFGFLEDCVDNGLFVAPGPSFGPYPTHIRVCYTSAEPAVVRRGIDTLARLIA